MYISSRKIAENTVFDLYFSRIEDRGNVTENYLTVAPKNISVNGTTGISILPVIGEKIALLKIFRPCVNETVWEIPRGFIHDNESATAAASRELEEEFPVAIKDLKLHELGLFMPEAGIIRARVALFYAELRIEGDLKVSDELGHTGYQLFSINEARKMIGQSEIQDPSTIISLYRYEFAGNA